MLGKPIRSASHWPALFVLVAATAPCFAGSEQGQGALHFFEGTTESASTVKVLMKKPYRSHWIGTGIIEPDGSLHLTQHVTDEGAPPKTRRWVIRQIGPHHFSGTMSEASGPVDVEEISGKYRFRFNIKGHLSAEEWLVPDPGGRSATTHISVRKFGFVVAAAEGIIRKVEEQGRD